MDVPVCFWGDSNAQLQCGWLSCSTLLNVFESRPHLLLLPRRGPAQIAGMRCISGQCGLQPAGVRQAHVALPMEIRRCKQKIHIRSSDSRRNWPIGKIDLFEHRRAAQQSRTVLNCLRCHPASGGNSKFDIGNMPQSAGKTRSLEKFKKYFLEVLAESEFPGRPFAIFSLSITAAPRRAQISAYRRQS